MLQQFLSSPWINQWKRCYSNYVFNYLRQSFTLVAQAGVQWRDVGSLQPRFRDSINSPPSASQSAEITGVSHRTRPWLPILMVISWLCAKQGVNYSCLPFPDNIGQVRHVATAFVHCDGTGGSVAVRTTWCHSHDYPGFADFNYLFYWNLHY